MTFVTGSRLFGALLGAALLATASTATLGATTATSTASTTSAAAPGVAVEAHAGLRAGRFHAAPQTYDLWTQELSASVRTASLAAVGPTTLHLGATAALSQMRGDLGPGLTSFVGYRVGPEARVISQPFAPADRLRAFGIVSYQYGSFDGEGSPNWDSNEAPTMFLMGAETLSDESKVYRTWGPHLAAGLTYDVAAAVAVSAIYDYGVETMVNDSTIISAGREIDGRSRTTYTSRSFLLGGAYTL